MRLLPGRALTAALFALSFPLAAGVPETLTKVLVDRDAVIRLTDSDLKAAGRNMSDADIDRLRLRVKGVERPSRLERLPAGSADGRFALEFLGEFPRGSKTYEDEFTTTSVYLLDVAPTAPRRFRTSPVPPGKPKGLARDTTTVSNHHEVNKKLIRFSGYDKPEESWFWAEIKATDEKPTVLSIPAPSAGAGPATLKVRFVGYSHLKEDPDHTVDVVWNGVDLGKAVFDGENAFVFEKELPEGQLAEKNQLALRALGETTHGIDLVLLDWVELSYPRLLRVGEGVQAEFRASAKEPVVLSASANAALEVYDTEDSRVFRVKSDAAGRAYFAPPARESRLFRAVLAGAALRPLDIRVTHPRDLTAAGLGADFVIVSHEAFLPAAEKLARARRAEGLKVEIVSVDDIYDRFRDGFFDPNAIRDFFKHARATWSPKPRYALLIGDASWDYKNGTVSDDDFADWHWTEQWGRGAPKNDSTGYGGVKTARNDRQFVPTYQFQSPWGNAASDNWFAMVDDGDDLPDLAIGRLPVATLEEANATVDKILDYGRLPPGALKDALFITNDEEEFQKQTDSLASEAGQEGYSVSKIYPTPEQKDNRENTENLKNAFNRGPALVLFNGHGGRYIWRTGPPDLKKNHDLFTLDHLDQLQETTGLPVVVSLTCYSAPFDHPVADSIGEKLLRLPHKGSVAVIASSWRNAPPLDFGAALIETLGNPATPRIGDAFLSSKRRTSDRVALFTYNLLGDPTTRYRGPAPPVVAGGTSK
ncbi:MAG: hypothetical protein JNK60_04150 [Acidobacteria bacterium]|nr:hypothetical protein [Acidobacteriota bacterium]